jgi:shikimate dehydrogenase
VDRVAPHKLAPSEEGVRALFAALPKKTLRAALIGGGIQESRTPWMHMAEGARLGLDYAYSLIDIDALGPTGIALETVLELAAKHGLAGLNVTHPFKQSIIPLLDELSDEAAAIGAVNTVVFAGGRSIGHNTDGWGFVQSFRSEMPGARLDHVLLIGAGGAGKAVARALCHLGAGHIDVFDLDRANSIELAASLRSTPGSPRAEAVRDVAEAAGRACGLVNATPVGMAKYPGMPVPPAVLGPALWVADIVYFPAETALLRAAAEAGCRTLPGKGMAVFQAVKAFELITGHRPGIEEMFGHFASALPTRDRVGVD